MVGNKVDRTQLVRLLSNFMRADNALMVTVQLSLQSVSPDPTQPVDTSQQLPFMLTSAKCSTNVDLAFTSLARAVLAKRAAVEAANNSLESRSRTSSVDSRGGSSRRIGVIEITRENVTEKKSLGSMCC